MPKALSQCSKPRRYFAKIRFFHPQLHSRLRPTAMSLPYTLEATIQKNVKDALEEDIGTGDITAQLIDETQQAQARIITREPAIIAGTAWVNAVFQQIDSDVTIEWFVKDGLQVNACDTLFELQGKTRSLLTGERAALNFLQTLSSVATKVAEYKKIVAATQVTLLDTRKTLPGLRLAQKYAITCGGGQNHRIGLYDAFLIKENHIKACGSITQAIQKARQIAPNKTCEIEVETLQEFEEALNADADIIMLDNFSNADKKIAVSQRNEKNSRTKLEASGGINNDTLLAVAETGVDFISIGSLTKDIQAIDLSMRLL